MVEDAPVLSGTLPNGGATGDALRLVECVGQKIGIRAKATKAKVTDLPVCRDRVDWWILFESAKNEISTVAAAGRANLPIVGVHGTFKIRGTTAEFWRMEYGFTPTEFFEHRKQIRLHISKDVLVGHGQNCKLGRNTSGTGLILRSHLDAIDDRKLQHGSARAGVSPNQWNHPLLHNVIDFMVTGAHPV
jgi:hypothetical protein